MPASLPPGNLSTATHGMWRLTSLSTPTIHHETRYCHVTSLHIITGQLVIPLTFTELGKWPFPHCISRDLLRVYPTHAHTQHKTRSLDHHETKTSNKLLNMHYIHYRYTHYTAYNYICTYMYMYMYIYMHMYMYIYPPVAPQFSTHHMHIHNALSYGEMLSQRYM